MLRQRPATLRQLASAPGLAKGTVSFDVGVLRDAGLIRVAETQQVRGGTEQHFALAGRGFRFHEDASAGPEFLLRAAAAPGRPRPGRGHGLLISLYQADITRLPAADDGDNAAAP